VVVDVENTDGTLMPYMTARLQFEVARRTGVLTVSNQALRWRPTLEQISPAVRAQLKAQAAEKARPAEEADAQDDAEEEKVDLESPAVWVVAEDGFVRPVKVRAGLSDGIDTEVQSGDLQPGDAVVVNAVRESKPDFVSSFISQITKK